METKNTKAVMNYNESKEILGNLAVVGSFLGWDLNL